MMLLYNDLRPSQTCHSKVMHQKEVTHSYGSYEKKLRRRAWLKKWDKVKILWYTHRLMHRKRVTCELHDSYFRLMSIKHAIPTIEWAIELFYISMWTGSQTSWRSDGLETRYGRECQHPAKGVLGTPSELGNPLVQDVVEKASTQQKAELRAYG